MLKIEAIIRWLSKTISHSSSQHYLPTSLSDSSHCSYVVLARWPITVACILAEGWICNQGSTNPFPIPRAGQVTKGGPIGSVRALWHKCNGRETLPPGTVTSDKISLKLGVFMCPPMDRKTLQWKSIKLHKERRARRWRYGEGRKKEGDRKGQKEGGREREKEGESS